MSIFLLHSLANVHGIIVCNTCRICKKFHVFVENAIVEHKQSHVMQSAIIANNQRRRISSDY